MKNRFIFLILKEKIAEIFEQLTTLLFQYDFDNDIDLDNDFIYYVNFFQQLNGIISPIETLLIIGYVPPITRQLVK